MKPKNPVFMIATLTERNELISKKYVEAKDELEAFKKYFELEWLEGNNLIGRTAKILPDGMTTIYTDE